MNAITKLISSLLAIIMSIFLFGKSEGFKPYITESVTTQTTQITLEAVNQTGFYIGDPRIKRIEKLEEGQWITEGEYLSQTEEYSYYHPLSVFRGTINFEHMGMNKTLDEGEYRVVVSFSITTSLIRIKPNQVAYAYFMVTAE